MKIYGTKKLDQKEQMHKCLSVFQNNLSKFLVTCLELGTNYKIALHEQVDAIGQEKEQIWKPKKPCFFMSENETRKLEFFHWLFFSECLRTTRRDNYVTKSVISETFTG